MFQLQLTELKNRGIWFLLDVKVGVKSQTTKIKDKIVIGLHTRGKNTIISKIIYFERMAIFNKKIPPEGT
jgi:hypothetical protein